MRRLLLLLLSAFILNGCSDRKETVTVDNKYSIELPSFLSKAKDLNDDASLQYQNLLKEFYIIVIDESKQELKEAIDNNGLTDTYSNDVDGYTDIALSGMEDKMKIYHKSEIKDTVINKMPARLITISGNTDGVEVFYSFAFVEGKENYYQVMTWTLLEKQQKYEDTMRGIIYTLKEL